MLDAIIFHAQEIITGIDWTSIISSFVSQSPGVVGVIVIAFLFLKTQRQRDEEFLKAIRQLTKEVAGVSGRFTRHDSWERNLYDAILSEHKRRSKAGSRASKSRK